MNKRIHDDARNVAYQMRDEAINKLRTGRVKAAAHKDMLNRIIKDATETIRHADEAERADRSDYTRTDIGFRSDDRTHGRTTNDRTYGHTTNDYRNDARNDRNDNVRNFKKNRAY